MLIERMEYSDEPSLVADLDGSIFRYCLFKHIAVEGKSVDAVFLSCELNDLDWYWACLMLAYLSIPSSGIAYSGAQTSQIAGF